ncbi:MAG: hypothetical protein WC988_03365 [Patescibacteria group bacterium]
MGYIIGVCFVAAVTEFVLSRIADGPARVVCIVLGVLCVLVAILFSLLWYDRGSSQSSGSLTEQASRKYVREQDDKGGCIMGWLNDFVRGEGDFGAGGCGDFSLGVMPSAKVRLVTYKTVDGHNVMIVPGMFVRVDRVDSRGGRDRSEEVTLGQARRGARGEKIIVDWMNENVADMTPAGGKTIKKWVTAADAEAAILERRRTGGIKGRG